MSQKLVLLLFLLILSHVIADDDDDDLKCLTKKWKSIKDDFIKSFVTLKGKVESFFAISLDKINKRRKKIQIAFYNFIDESFGDLDKGNVMQMVSKMDEGMSAPQMIAAQGQKVQSYTTLTEDGFVLTLHRVISEDLDTTRAKKIILLHHGLFGSSDDWLLLGKDKALPYILSAAGYDVWLTNARGNKYSRVHINKTVDTSSFWDFSWHEIGVYDLSALINYVVDISTNEIEIHFIGYSLGATALLVLLSASPKYNQVLKSATLLAPLVFMYQIKGPLKVLAEDYRYYASDNYRKPTFLLQEQFSPKIVERFCKGEVELCLNPLLLLTSGGQDFSDSYVKDAVLAHVPAGGSKKTLVHYLQLLRSGDFHMFDYGFKLNTKRYGSHLPPRYDLSKITVPIAVFSSANDWLATVPGVVSLLNSLRTVIVNHIVRQTSFSHTDFLWSNNAPELVYYLILDILKNNFENKTVLKYAMP